MLTSSPCFLIYQLVAEVESASLRARAARNVAFIARFHFVAAATCQDDAMERKRERVTTLESDAAEMMKLLETLVAQRPRLNHLAFSSRCENRLR